MDSITRIKEFIKSNFPDWEKISFSEFQESIDFRDDFAGTATAKDTYSIFQ